MGFLGFTIQMTVSRGGFMVWDSSQYASISRSGQEVRSRLLPKSEPRKLVDSLDA